MQQDEATRLLNRAAEGELAAAAELLPLVYDELRRLAAACFRGERDDHTLEPTALVHEAFLRLVDGSSVGWRSRNQFFAVAAKAMRNILVDHARSRDRLKRGGDWRRASLESAARILAAEDPQPRFEPWELVRLHEALEALAEVDERKASLVELRYFAGLGLEEAAEALGIARSTASEDWRMARAWLHRELKRSGVDGP